MASIWTAHVRAASASLLPVSRLSEALELLLQNPLFSHFHVLCFFFFFLSIAISHSCFVAIKVRVLWDGHQFRSELIMDCNCPSWNRRAAYRKLVVKAVDSDDDRRLQNDAIVAGNLEEDNAKKPQLNVVAKLQESIGSLPVLVSVIFCLPLFFPFLFFFVQVFESVGRGLRDL